LVTTGNWQLATGNWQLATIRQQLSGSVSALLLYHWDQRLFTPSINHHFPIANMSGETIKSAKFQGHQAPVLSLAVSQHDSLLLSGSEDHTARLWDLRDNNKRRASLCIQTGGDVLSVVFAPKQEEQSSKLSNLFARDLSMYVFSFLYDFVWYLNGSKVSFEFSHILYLSLSFVLDTWVSRIASTNTIFGKSHLPLSINQLVICQPFFKTKTKSIN
jgi:hypothetical protein